MVETTEVYFPGCSIPLRVLKHRADRHNFARWEECWIPHLVQSVSAGDVVFDVGAEQGEFGALCARLGARVHLFEPSTTSWPALRAIFQANGLVPSGCFHGFAATMGMPREDDLEGWPEAALGKVREEVDFYVHSERPDIRQVSLDSWTLAKGVKPDIIMIDVEGAEVHVIAGAREILQQHRPIVFVSIHPPEFIGRFGIQHAAVCGGRKVQAQQEHLFRLFSELGYTGDFLGEDHESHWQFVPR